MNAIDLSSFAGLTAMVLLALNVVLGILVSRNYSPARRWPRRKIPIFRIHNWTAYTALAFVLVHPTLLLFADKPRFHAADLLYPVNSPGQNAYNTLGAIALYTVMVVVVTSYFRPKLGSRPWKKIHYAAYFAAAVLFLHGLLIDPDLKNRPPDLLDGEKVLVEGCLVAVCAAGLWRLRQKRKMV
ncbi:MAG TPA: ferric reductase-like transmembrane domain-containing protein [Candidatus Acidoferrales bacterium]|nr:ferric reductase-like transmembrane domain-containing protein [Candidatus Acidoferrales bacterium]HXK06529.1 ferric reductase-like transmembrane domain-containing protein [Verrucomicrobiae bacterium]